MLSIKDYARNKNVSYEAVRTQIKRYSDDLKGHITKQGRTRFLDEHAIAFLDAKRKDNPVVIVNSSKSEELDLLREENARLKDALLEAQNKLLDAQEEKIRAIEAQNRVGVLEAQIDASNKERDYLKQEISSYKKTIFGLYRKV